MFQDIFVLYLLYKVTRNSHFAKYIKVPRHHFNIIDRYAKKRFMGEHSLHVAVEVSD